MQAAHPAETDALLMEVHAAKLLSLSVRTLQAWRLKGSGPAYVQAGRAIRYRRCDVLAWIDANIIDATPKAREGQRVAK